MVANAILGVEELTCITQRNSRTAIPHKGFHRVGVYLEIELGKGGQEKVDSCHRPWRRKNGSVVMTGEKLSRRPDQNIITATCCSMTFHPEIES